MNEQEREALEEKEYDRRRLPGAYAATMHHIRELYRDMEQLMSRGLPGDRFRAAKTKWFIRNNENYARRIKEHAAELGLYLGEAQEQLPLI